MNARGQEIAAAKVAFGSLRVWWIGQEGSVIKSPRSIIYIDPYLSDYAERITRVQPNEHVPITQPPLTPEGVDHADLVFCTHDYDKFTLNTGDVDEFVRLAKTAGLPYRVMQAGEYFTFPELR